MWWMKQPFKIYIWILKVYWRTIARFCPLFWLLLSEERVKTQRLKSSSCLFPLSKNHHWFFSLLNYSTELFSKLWVAVPNSESPKSISLHPAVLPCALSDIQGGITGPWWNICHLQTYEELFCLTDQSFPPSPFSSPWKVLAPGFVKPPRKLSQDAACLLNTVSVPRQVQTIDFCSGCNQS